MNNYDDNSPKPKINLEQLRRERYKQKKYPSAQNTQEPYQEYPSAQNTQEPYQEYPSAQNTQEPYQEYPSAQNTQLPYQEYPSEQNTQPAYQEDLSVQNTQPKNHIYYNESALTLPNKKNNAVIIGIFIVLVALLLTGIIGLAINLDKDMEQKGRRDVEKYWRDILVFKDVSDMDTVDEDSEDEEFLEEDTQNKVMYSDYESKISVGVPDEYTFILDGDFYGTEQVSGVMYSMSDDDGNVINVSAEYKLSADSDKEYNTIKNRGQNVKESNVRVSTETEKGKILNYELPNGTKESCAVISSIYPKDAVIIITCSSDDSLDKQDLQKAVLAVFSTMSVVFDPPMN